MWKLFHRATQLYQGKRRHLSSAISVVVSFKRHELAFNQASRGTQVQQMRASRTQRVQVSSRKTWCLLISPRNHSPICNLAAAQEELFVQPLRPEAVFDPDDAEFAVGEEADDSDPARREAHDDSLVDPFNHSGRISWEGQNAVAVDGKLVGSGQIR